MDFQFLLVAVNAKFIHSNPAIYSLRAYAEESNRQYVALAEYTINQSMEEILADIYRRKPNVIGFSCYIWNWKLIRELLVEVPKLLPDTAIWLGGPEVSYDTEVILRQYPWLAGVMTGEGEATFRELLTYYVNKCHGEAGGEAGEEAEQSLSGTEKFRLSQIRGLCLPTGYTSPRPFTDMNTIPFLYEDMTPFENRIIYYETSRGCPFRCSYCLSSIEKSVRFRDIAIVKKELQFFLDHRVKQIKFVDRTFNCNHEHAMEIWEYIYQHDNGYTNFHFEISADILREEEIALLNCFRPGLAQLEIGVQSVNSQTLQAIGRVMDVEKLEKIVAAIHQGGNIHQHLDLIAGLPFEDYKSFEISFLRVYGMQPEQLQLGFLKVLKGSGMWERAREYGIQYLDKPPYEVLCTRWLSYEDVLRLKGIEEMVELYYNSAQFTHTLPFLEKAFRNPFVMYETLADFYRQKGYDKQSPARAYRYNILLEFAVTFDGSRWEVYRELLTYDMYLRENLKSRPEFAVDLSGWKDVIRDFYQEEEKCRRFLPDYADYNWKQLSKMTHLEPFTYPVWDAAQMTAGYEEWKKENGTAEDSCGRTCSPCFLLFDYRKRNPFTYAAEARLI